MITHADSFVLFSLGDKRFALPAARVSELARPDTIHPVPNTTNHVSGVLLRRGEVIPVCDIAPALKQAEGPSRKFFLIAKRRFEVFEELTAIPVSGNCELANLDPLPLAGKLAENVIGLLSLQNEIVEILDLEKLLSTEAQ